MLLDNTLAYDAKHVFIVAYVFQFLCFLFLFVKLYFLCLVVVVVIRSSSFLFLKRKHNVRTAASRPTVPASRPGLAPARRLPRPLIIVLSL